MRRPLWYDKPTSASILVRDLADVYDGVTLIERYT